LDSNARMIRLCVISIVVRAPIIIAAFVDPLPHILSKL
jgi:hypothetical protein